MWILQGTENSVCVTATHAQTHVRIRGNYWKFIINSCNTAVYFVLYFCLISCLIKELSWEKGHKEYTGLFLGTCFLTEMGALSGWTSHGWSGSLTDESSERVVSLLLWSNGRSGHRVHQWLWLSHKWEESSRETDSKDAEWKLNPLEPKCL